MHALQFSTIDLARHRDTCLEFRRDSYICSFADGNQRFCDENGEDGNGYIDWLRERIADLPQGCVHAWENDLIVGQIESRIRADNTGYVNLFYIAPNARRRGLGRKLNDYVIAMFSSLDVDVARLTVSIENERAIGFYRSLGWIDLGLRPGRTDSRLFETAIKKT